ncbi:MAG: hypothetical protein ACI3ZY_06040 [Parabacteroides sp.]
MMKQLNYFRIMAATCSVAILCNGCASMHPATRAQVATQSGMMLGSGFGAVLGDQIDSRYGSFWGSLLGGAAGLAIGAAAASSYEQQQKEGAQKEYIYAESNPHRVSRVNYEQGPALTISDIMLRDRNGNRRIDAGEDCQISFIIGNVGNRPAYEVRPSLKAKGNAKRILLSPPKSIRQITEGQKISYTVQARATDKLKSGTAEFVILLEDGAGQVLCEEPFSVNTNGRH